MYSWSLIMFFANLLQILVIFLPAFVANAAPVVAKNIPYMRDFSQPIHKRWFGKNKTIRGYATGIIAGMITGLCLYAFRWALITILPAYSDFYNLYTSWYIGILLGGYIGFTALLGDIIESFIKRRYGLKPGATFQPWDSIDYTLMAGLCMIPWYNIGLINIVALMIIGIGLSFWANFCAYKMGWKESWY